MLPLQNDLDKQIEQARKNVAQAERHGNFNSAHHEVLQNLLKAKQDQEKGQVNDAE